MIGTLDPAEAAAAIALWRATGLTRPWNDPAADLAAALACPTAHVLAARHAGALAGTVMVGWDGHRGWLYYLAVAADRRGQGLGLALVAAAEAWLAVRGAPKAQLMVRAGNEAAHAFYARLGYRPQAVTVLGRALEAQPSA